MIQFLASALGTRNTETIAEDFVADYGALGDGSHDNAPDLVEFQTFAVAQTSPVMLMVTAGDFLMSTNVAKTWVSGIRNLNVVGAGAGLATFRRGGTAQDLWYGSVGQYNDATHHAFVATVAAGAAQVQCLTPSEASRFVVGTYAYMAGIDIQGLWGAPFGLPSNNHFFDIVKILAANSGTGVVTFDRALANSYKSTWPVYFAGSAFGCPQGGAAILYALPASWDTDVTIQGLKIDNGASYTIAKGRSISWQECEFTNIYGAIPSENEYWEVVDCNYSHASAKPEIDKFIHQFRFVRTTVNTVWTQSSSVNYGHYIDSTIGTIEGTPRHAVIQGGTTGNLRPGAAAYGCSDSVTIGPSDAGNAVISGVNANGIGGYADDGNGHTGFTNEMTMTDGVIISPNVNDALRWAIPGANIFWIGSTSFEVVGMFRVVDVTQDATNTYVQTTETGSWPVWPMHASGYFNIRPHICPRWNCVGATGSVAIVDLSQSGAQDRPLYEYTKRRYTGDSAQATATIELLTATSDTSKCQRMWGALNFIEIVVEAPYTGGGAAVNFHLSQFSNWNYIKADGSTAQLAVVINTKIAGTRRGEPGMAWTGLQSGDSVTDLSTIPYLWFGGKASAPILSRTVSGDAAGPVWTVELDCSQGVVVSRARTRARKRRGAYP